MNHAQKRVFVKAVTFLAALSLSLEVYSNYQAGLFGPQPAVVASLP